MQSRGFGRGDRQSGNGFGREDVYRRSTSILTSLDRGRVSPARRAGSTLFTFEMWSMGTAAFEGEQAVVTSCAATCLSELFSLYSSISGPSPRWSCRVDCCEPSPARPFAGRPVEYPALDLIAWPGDTSITTQPRPSQLSGCPSARQALSEVAMIPFPDVQEV